MQDVGVIRLLAVFSVESGVLDQRRASDVGEFVQEFHLDLVVERCVSHAQAGYIEDSRQHVDILFRLLQVVLVVSFQHRRCLGVHYVAMDPVHLSQLSPYQLVLHTEVVSWDVLQVGGVHKLVEEPYEGSLVDHSDIHVRDHVQDLGVFVLAQILDDVEVTRVVHRFNA